jgi:putative ubiquitin-RnfH superfamily antitoxin RatB of RatAB toxin-antitoxin module
MKIEVAFASASRQVVIPVDVPEETTLEAAIQKSGILSRCPEIDLTTQKVGVFARVKPLTTIVSAGDRIEIYRPTTATLSVGDDE